MTQLFTIHNPPSTPATAYVAQPGDLVLTPAHGLGIISDLRNEPVPSGYWRRIASVRVGDGGWQAIDVEQLNPALTAGPWRRTANFAAILAKDLQSFAPGFGPSQVCDGCHQPDIDLVEIDGARVCPACASEIKESSTKGTNEHE